VKILEVIQEDAWKDFIGQGLGDLTGGSRGILSNLKDISKTPDTTSSATTTSSASDTSGTGSGQPVVIGNEKRTGGTISWRTNNPGNVEYGDFAKGYGAIGWAMSGDGEKVAVMPTLDAGIKMQIALWRRPSYNNRTIDQGAQRWAGANAGKRNTPYAQALASAAGATIDTKVSDLSDSQVSEMVKAQMKLEGFKPGTVTTA